MRNIKDYLYAVFETVPHIKVPVTFILNGIQGTLTEEIEFNDMSVVDLCCLLGIENSKAKVKSLIQGGGLYMNGNKVNDAKLRILKETLLENRFILMRKGKRQCFVIYLENMAAAMERSFEEKGKFIDIEQ